MRHFWEMIKNKFKIIIIILLLTNILTFVLLLFMINKPFESKNITHSIPNKIYLEKEFKNYSAYILQGTNENMLASSLYYLAVKKKDSEMFVLKYDIQKGQGDYEGDILGLYWINNTDILIDRIIYDQRTPIVFSLETWNWKEISQEEADRIIARTKNGA
jgi:hypothetical protein